MSWRYLVEVACEEDGCGMRQATTMLPVLRRAPDGRAVEVPDVLLPDGWSSQKRAVLAAGPNGNAQNPVIIRCKKCTRRVAETQGAKVEIVQ